jgi:dephospho-CoA kinase
MKSPIIIGITGGIGGGKTTLSDNLRAVGYFVYDSDLEARRLQNENSIIRNQLLEVFGNDIYADNELNRKLLANLVFGKPDLLAKLNSIVHPVVRNDFHLWTELHKSEKLLFMESAILFESGFNELVDKVIVMTASEEIRIARVIKRDGSTLEQVKARMSHQLKDEVKISKADFVIHSDDNQPLVNKMHFIIQELLAQTS